MKQVVVWAHRHVFRSIGATVATLALVLFALLNPWGGSAWCKHLLIRSILGDDDDVSYVLRQADRSQDFSKIVSEGARKAGYYRVGDEGIVEQWAAMYSDRTKTNDESKLPAATYKAVIEARHRAETRMAPFQSIGSIGVASSPSCFISRPPINQVFIRANSYLAGPLLPGKIIRITRLDGVGLPVIAQVNLNTTMPQDTDIYLNRRQMLDFLRYSGRKVSIQVVITTDSPNQDAPDLYAPDVEVDCSHG